MTGAVSTTTNFVADGPGHCGNGNPGDPDPVNCNLYDAKEHVRLSGLQLTATSSGEWHKVAWDRWTTTMTGTISNGRSFKGEGVFDISARTWSGTFDL